MTYAEPDLIVIAMRLDAGDSNSIAKQSAYQSMLSYL